MNNCMFIGRLTRDVELKQTTNGVFVTNVSLAIRNGKDDTTFVDVKAFKSTAELLSKYCKKGDLIAVSCILKNNNWTDRDGKNHYDYSFLTNKIQLLTSKQNNTPQTTDNNIPQNAKTEYKENEITLSDNDLPF